MTLLAPQIAGLVLAGGRSRRFGRDKALAELGGVSLLERASARLRDACGDLGVSLRGGGETETLAARLGLTRIVDPPGLPSGPLSGILAGLLWARGVGAELLVTLPCDAPFLPQDLASRLIAAAAEAPCAVARTPDGFQSLCAAWRVEMIPRLDAPLSAGTHPPVHAVLEAAGCAVVDYADATAFLNVNSPEDLAEAERRLAAGRA